MSFSTKYLQKVFQK